MPGLPLRRLGLLFTVIVAGRPISFLLWVSTLYSSLLRVKTKETMGFFIYSNLRKSLYFKYLRRLLYIKKPIVSLVLTLSRLEYRVETHRRNEMGRPATMTVKRSPNRRKGKPGIYRTRKDRKWWTYQAWSREEALKLFHADLAKQEANDCDCKNLLEAN